ncbi:MAG: tRNA isopentenyl-2-thiomethyl-A-37 hydroxylase MiaE [Planctomycetota bacterium]|jgi:tRNA-(ms[2]io[6]A)-hydroxylase
MLELAHTTDASWARAVGAHPVELLCDHAHCELGAAASAQALIHRHARDTGLVERMGALAAEELAHFRQVHGLIAERGGRLEPGLPNPYVEGLLKAAKRSSGPWLSAMGERDAGLLDRLLVSGLIEARSHERFGLLAEHLEDAELRALYAELGPSEHGHAHLFPKLASERFDADRVERRAAELVDLEGALVAGLPFAPRMHSGAPA